MKVSEGSRSWGMLFVGLVGWLKRTEWIYCQVMIEAVTKAFIPKNVGLVTLTTFEKRSRFHHTQKGRNCRIARILLPSFLLMMKLSHQNIEALDLNPSHAGRQCVATCWLPSRKTPKGQRTVRESHPTVGLNSGLSNSRGGWPTNQAKRPSFKLSIYELPRHLSHQDDDMKHFCLRQVLVIPTSSNRIPHPRVEGDFIGLALSIRIFPLQRPGFCVIGIGPATFIHPKISTKPQSLPSGRWYLKLGAKVHPWSRNPRLSSIKFPWRFGSDRWFSEIFFAWVMSVGDFQPEKSSRVYLKNIPNQQILGSDSIGPEPFEKKTGFESIGSARIFFCRRNLFFSLPLEVNWLLGRGTVPQNYSFPIICLVIDSLYTRDQADY